LTNDNLSASDTAYDWRPIRGETLASEVYEAIRAAILEGRFAPGEFVREGQISQALGVSRTPVREAMGRLASEGFLERIPHRGFFLPEEPLEHLLQLYPIIASLDLLSGRLALARLDEEGIAALRETNAALQGARDAHDVRGMIALNNQFHHLFAERSGNQRLSALLTDLRLQLTRLERWYYSDLEKADVSISEHGAIISAIEDGDHDRALELLEHNMAGTYRQLSAELGLRNG
jgi:DNA-binding GntR family transcriptional regulator